MLGDEGRVRRSVRDIGDLDPAILEQNPAVIEHASDGRLRGDRTSNARICAAGVPAFVTGGVKNRNKGTSTVGQQRTAVAEVVGDRRRRRAILEVIGTAAAAAAGEGGRVTCGRTLEQIQNELDLVDVPVGAVPTVEVIGLLKLTRL